MNIKVGDSILASMKGKEVPGKVAGIYRGFSLILAQFHTELDTGYRQEPTHPDTYRILTLQLEPGWQIKRGRPFAFLNQNEFRPAACA